MAAARGAYGSETNVVGSGFIRTFRGGNDRAHRLEPADKAAAALRRVRVPAAARRHHADRRERRIAAADFGDDVEGLGARARGERDHTDLGR